MTNSETLERLCFPVGESKLVATGSYNEVFESPMTTRRLAIEVPTHKAIIRQDTQELVSVVSSKYELVSNEYVFKNTLEVLENLGYSYIIDPLSSQISDSRVILHVYLKDVKIDDGDSPIHLSMFIRNSYDMSLAYGFRLGTFRVKCVNGALLGYKELTNEIYRKHTSGLKISDTKKVVLNALEVFPKLIERIEAYKEIDFDANAEKLIKEAKRILGKQFIKQLTYTGKVYRFKSLYDFYLECTRYTSHEVNPVYQESTRKEIAEAFRL